MGQKSSRSKGGRAGGEEYHSLTFSHKAASTPKSLSLHYIIQHDKKTSSLKVQLFKVTNPAAKKNVKLKTAKELLAVPGILSDLEGSKVGNSWAKLLRPHFSDDDSVKDCTLIWEIANYADASETDKKAIAKILQKSNGNTFKCTLNPGELFALQGGDMHKKDYHFAHSDGGILNVETAGRETSEALDLILGMPEAECLQIHAEIRAALSSTKKHSTLEENCTLKVPEPLKLSSLDKADLELLCNVESFESVAGIALSST